MVVARSMVRLIGSAVAVGLMFSGCATAHPMAVSVGPGPTGASASGTASSTTVPSSTVVLASPGVLSSPIVLSSPAAKAAPSASTGSSTPATPSRTIPPVAIGGGNMADPHTEPSLTAATVTVGAGAHVVVDQLQSDCCFAEGTISYLVIRDAAGAVITWREFDPGEIGRSTLGLDVTIDPGSYTVDSFQRPCDANCGFLDPPTIKCSHRVTLRSKDIDRMTVRWSVRDQRCTFSG